MKQIIKNLIEIAKDTEDFNEQCRILDEIKNLIDELARTINCPSNWRSIAEELAKEYNTIEYGWIYVGLGLWEYTE